MVFVAAWTNWTLVLARVDVSGRLQTNFAANTLQTAGSFSKLRLGQQPDGRIIVCGQRLLDNRFSEVVLRLNADGSADTSFRAESFPGEATYLRVTSDGTIAITVWDGSEIRLLILNTDGSLHSEFRPAGFIGGYQTPVTLLDDGSIVASPGDKVFHFLANGEYKTVQVGLPNYSVHWLVPLPKSRLGLIYHPDCAGPACSRGFFRILSLPISGNDALFTWQPPRVPDHLDVLAERLEPDAEYVPGVSRDFRVWDYARSEFSFERTFDRRSAIFHILFSRPNEPGEPWQFYRLKRLE